MMIRYIGLLGLTIVATLWNTQPVLKGWAAECMSGASSDKSSRVLHLSRDEFASLKATANDSVGFGSANWSSRWTRPAWGDLPARTARAVSAVASAATSDQKRPHETNVEVVTVVLIIWFSLCGLYAARVWAGNSD